MQIKLLVDAGKNAEYCWVQYRYWEYDAVFWDTARKIFEHDAVFLAHLMALHFATQTLGGQLIAY